MRLSVPVMAWQANEHERAMREFTCTLCKGILAQPLSTPCGHHFCKPCLLTNFQVCNHSLKSPFQNALALP